MTRIRLNVTIVAAAMVTALATTQAPAYADTPLPAPTNLQAVHVADTSADLWWLSDGLSQQDVAERFVNGHWTEYSRGLHGVLNLTGLSRATTYTFRFYSIPVTGLGYTTSPRSAPISFTTLAAPDSIPPSQPPTPIFSSITTTMVNVYVGEATDNVQVTGYYLQQLVNGGWTTIRTIRPPDTRQPTISGLSPSTTYTFAVQAFDAQGNVSVRSVPGSVTTLALTAYPVCKTQIITFGTGFQAYATILNSSAMATSGWTIRFLLPSTVTTGPSFNGTLTRDATGGTIVPFVWDAVIGPGGQVTVGFSGSAATPAPPTGFTLDGRPCTNA